MSTFSLITTFRVQKAGFNLISDFIKREFYSPTLEKRRSAIKNPFKSKSKSAEPTLDNPQEKKKFTWGDLEKDKKESEEVDWTEVSEDRLNDSLDELTDEDYNDFAEIGIELFDYGLDRLFIFLGRIPTKVDSQLKSKKERLKKIAGRLFRKWGVKFSLEMLGAMLLIFYINARWTQSQKADKSETGKKPKGKGKVIQMNAAEEKAEKLAEKSKPKEQPKKVSLM